MRGCGIVALAMGKLGARELNYSSDIDLVLLHDPEAGLVETSTPVFTRIARVVVALLETRDADGYAFRTDLRLRPDPAATPPSVALPAAITYYESMGQTWERAAMLRARPIAGDLALGATFLEAIRPFIWRRGLDFAAIADLHAMKQRIDAHKGTALDAAAAPLQAVAGHDVKLGQGGIREIEFIVQTLQLVWGGRDPALRTPRTVDGLARLARAHHLPRRAAAELGVAYRFLRRVEHRLQMVADRQTHALPPDAAGLARFAIFMGAPDAAGFARRLFGHLARVQTHFAGLLAFVPTPAEAPAGAAGLESAEGLAALGFADAAAALAAIASWRAGRPRALRSERARQLLAAVLPPLLRALARQAHPDAALARFDRLLASLPAGVQPLSLFHRNPHLLTRVADVLGAAPRLAEHLAGNPAALEGLLVPAASEPVAERLGRRLADARGLEDVIAITRRTVREEDFSLSVATLEGRLDADSAGRRRSELADAAIAALLPAVLADMRRRHGAVPGGDLAVVLLGKAGGGEMMAGSDLDLLFVYDHPPEVTQSETDGGPAQRPQPASQWFIRAVHGFVAAITAPDAGGALYAVDMRLRPSGNKGPVAVSLAAFRHYHRAGGEAWTWERMALTRARVVAGGAALCATLAAAIRDALTHAGPPELVRADAAAMRARLWRDARPPGPPFALRDAKLRPGGLVECEFVAQALQLIHARDTPPPFSPCTGEALRRLAEAGALPGEAAALLARADLIWRTLLGMLRLTAGHSDADISGAALGTLLHAVRAAGADPAAVDLPGLHATLEALATRVRETFVRHLGPLPELVATREARG
jgi:glutamate-ammonia-ligase adenylyltransferase